MQHDLIDQPSEWVARFAPLIPPGETLDLACGGGRHARLLAGLGHPVIALDRDTTAVARTATAGVTPFQHDLEQDGAPWPFETGRFAGIVVTNYLHRPLFPLIVDSLAPGGVLIYETFAQGNERFGKPSNPAFLLAPGELLGLLRPAMRIVAFEDGYIDSPKPAMVQRVFSKIPHGTGLSATIEYFPLYVPSS
jgi:SAM-dependent methyltransferase